MASNGHARLCTVLERDACPSSEGSGSSITAPAASLRWQVLSQEEVEAGLRFCGFSLLVNALRPDTAAVVGQLHDAGIRTAMVTGDHVVTAVSVAGQCGMLCQNRPVCVADTAAAEGRVADTQLSLRVLQPDGSTSPTVTVELGPLLQQVGGGTLQAAVTGRGFEKVGAGRAAGPGGVALAWGGLGAGGPVAWLHVGGTEPCCRCCGCWVHVALPAAPGATPHAALRPCSWRRTLRLAGWIPCCMARPSLRACRRTTSACWWSCWARAR